MTRERKITLLILTTTLIVGVLLGLLIPGFFHKYRSHENGRQDGHPGDHHRDGHRGDISKKDWFANTIFQVVQPDSIQFVQIKPVTDWAAHEIGLLESSSNARMSAILDSVKIQLEPILTAGQKAKLGEFQEKTRGRWKTSDRH